MAKSFSSLVISLVDAVSKVTRKKYIVSKQAEFRRRSLQQTFCVATGLQPSFWFSCRRAVEHFALHTVLQPQNLFHDTPANIRQPKMAALIFVGEPCVVDSQAAQNGRLQIVDVDGVPRDVVAVVVGFA